MALFGGAPDLLYFLLIWFGAVVLSWRYIHSFVWTIIISMVAGLLLAVPPTKYLNLYGGIDGISIAWYSVDLMIVNWERTLMLTAIQCLCVLVFIWFGCVGERFSRNRDHNAEG
jgi:hypothetical protein